MYRYIYHIGSKLLVCNYDFNTGEYNFIDLGLYDTDTGIDLAWVYKLITLYKNNEYDVYVNIGDCSILGNLCKVYLTFFNSINTFYLNMEWSSISRDGFLSHFDNIINGYFQSTNNYYGMYPLKSYLILPNSSIVQAFVDNPEFCLQFCVELFNLADSEYRAGFTLS